MHKRHTIYLLALLILWGCKEPDTSKEEEKLMQLSRDWSKLAATDSMEKILSYWADDAIIMQPGLPTLKGKSAIRDMVEGSFKIPSFAISWEPLQAVISKSGDMAYMIEQNKITVNDSLGNPVTTYNKGVTIWRKEPDGSWKSVVDVWNEDPAPRN